MVFTAERLLQILESFPAVNSYLVGFSGGADSTALLHALSTIRGQLDAPVSAVHVNHGLHADADHWQLQCETFCHRYSIELTCLKVDLKNCKGKGLEAEARHLRYAAISALVKSGDCLLTAHHADDQAETLLLNLMRGSGVDGLTAMPESRQLGSGVLQRPLLRFKNRSLREYLSVNNIEWTEDPSNQHLEHDRNFVRHTVIPLLEQRWPEVSQRLLLTQQAMTDARHLLENLADEYLVQNLSHAYVLQITPQCRANPELFRLVIRRWMKQSGAANIPTYKLASFCAHVRQANSDSKASVQWDGWLLRWYKDQLWLQTETEILPCPTIKWPVGQSEIDLGNDVGQLEFNTGKPSKNRLVPGDSIFPTGVLSVGSRLNSSEAVISLGRIHKSLKNLFQSVDIPPWLRDSIPLCKLDGELVAVGDWCFNERFAAWLSENDIRLRWCPQHPLLQFIVKQQHAADH